MEFAVLILTSSLQTLSIADVAVQKLAQASSLFLLIYPTCSRVLVLRTQGTMASEEIRAVQM